MNRNICSKLLFSLFTTCALLLPARTGFAQTASNTIPVVTIVATDPLASESGDTGTFTVHRAGSTNSALNVFYLIGGTASNGIDYTALPNTVLIPAGATSATIKVVPIDDNLVEGDETVILHLGQPPYLPPVNYIIGTPDTATVIIKDNDTNGTNLPPVVSIVSPLNGAIFAAPADISIFASAADPDGFVATVEFFSGATSLGITTNNPASTSPVNPFHYHWTNVLAGDYVLTAVATDNGGAMATSAPVKISVRPPVTNPPVVTIVATDPIAVENGGTNLHCFVPPTVFTNYCTGTNTATFLVRRIGETNADLTVEYAISGTASNGVDYAALSGEVTIPAGRRFALITIVPLEDIDPTARLFDTVVLALKQQPAATAGNPPPYLVGWPGKAGAVILEENDVLRPSTGTLPDGCFHLGMLGTNGLNFCIQVSTNLTDWTSVCTNTVVKSAIHFVDPEACGLTNRYYRAVPVPGPAFY
jgi:hypothetical protein